ncbi:unnamed protein product [Rotaria sp. Silwood2]|nr:unnamed protein product [Rotaria sp. Silwood2]
MINLFICFLVIAAHLFGRTDSRIPIEPDGILTVELQYRTLADAPARVIARYIDILPIVKKTQWPELVGTNGQDPAKIIKQERWIY